MPEPKLSPVLLVVVLAAVVAGHAGPSRADEVCPMRFAVLGDRTGGHVPGIYAEIVEEIRRMKPDFVVGVGDMIEGYAGDTTHVKQEWKDYMALLEPLTMPVYLVPGNHEICDEASSALYGRYAGKPYYSFDEGPAHFIVLDTSRWDSISTFPSEQMEWLEVDLAANSGAAHTFVVFHKPYWIESIAAGQADALHDVFVRHGVDAVFTGHWHVYFSGEFDGVLYTGVGSSGGTCEPGVTGLQYHWVWVTVDDEGISVTPIKMGSILPWNEVTAGDIHFVRAATEQAFEIGKVALGTSLSLDETRIDVRIRNLDSLMTLETMLAWEVPPNWHVNPARMPVAIAPGEEHLTHFSIESEGPVYPAPVLALDYPVGPEKTLSLKQALPLARTAYATRTDRGPEIDGVVDEPCWVEPVSDLFAPDGSPVKTDPADFYFTWDNDNLYLAAICRESQTDSIVADGKDHDASVYGEDCVGYFLQPLVPEGPVYQIYFNPIGTCFDQLITVSEGIGVGADRKWNGTYEVGTSRGAEEWSIEVAIPLAQLGCRASGGDVWAVNFRRKQKHLGTTADWQVPISYNPKEYGVLVFR